ncbi:MAG: DUF4105 domain-containing protein [Candidatus Campbellbacteria bacterium]|nr:DUF4105 domain-containing protein [Candidatus Campbellbacteria bacterium]
MLRLLSKILLFAIAMFALFVFFKEPTNDREWTPDLAKLAQVEIYEGGEGTKVGIKNIRDSTYEDGEENIQYYSQIFDLAELKKVWFLVEPFSDWEAAAHTFFVFDFKDGQSIGFSVEARKEKNEKYSALRGLFREYELHYLFASERDLVLRRTDHLDHEVYMYPIDTNRENVRNLFLRIANRADELESEPAFYNTITSSCTTTLVRHINETSPNKIKWWHKAQYLPGLSDRLAYDLGLIDTDLPFEETREQFSIKEKANDCASSDNFSLCLREKL